MRIEEINSAIRDYTRMLEESFEVLTNIQEDPNIQCLEIEVRELQQHYDNVKGTAQTVALTERLAQMQQDKVVNEQMGIAQHREFVLKVRVQPWIGKAFVIIEKIEGKPVQMQGMQEHIQGSNSNTMISEQYVQEIQQVVSQCAADLCNYSSRVIGSLCVEICTYRVT